MQLNTEILREYDVRGVYGESLRDQDAYALGQRFGTLIKQSGGKNIVVSRDGRLSSPTLLHHLVTGLVDVGIQVKDIGLCPTPALYFAALNTGADGAIMITGSHNPPSHNGFKMMVGAKPFYGEMIKGLIDVNPVLDQGGEVTTLPIESSYIDRLLQDYISGHSLKVVWDAGNGATGPMLKVLTDRLPGTHILLHTDIDGTFPNHAPDPTNPKNLKVLMETIVREGADVGFAFDGDGDRVVAVDSQGRMLAGDQMLLLFAKEVLKTHPGAPIVGDIKSSQVLFDGIKALGGEPVMARTGHSNIKALMPKIKSPLAGEMSGHVFFADKYFGYDDGPYGAIRLLSLLNQSSESLAQMFDALPKTFVTPEIKMACENRFDLMDELKVHLKKQGVGFIDTDGVRVQSSKGWWLVRPSNTEEILVCRCESYTEQGLELEKKTLLDALAAVGFSVEI